MKKVWAIVALLLLYAFYFPPKEIVAPTVLKRFLEPSRVPITSFAPVPRTIFTPQQKVTYQEENYQTLKQYIVTVWNYETPKKYRQNTYIVYYDTKLKKEIKWEDIVVDIKSWEKKSGSHLCFLNKVGITCSDPSASFSYEEIYSFIKEDYLPQTEAFQIFRKKEILKNKKIVALTFDDGPSKQTSTLLDGLKARNVKVTFFVLGECMKKYPDLVKRMATEGHELGLHTYHHVNLLKTTPNKRKEEFEKSIALMREILGTTTSFLRPPYGNYDQDILKNYDLSLILWSVDPEDWKYRHKDKVVENIMREVEDGDIILLHDLYQTSVEAALEVIDRLKDQDYMFVTVSELASLRGNGIQKNQVYRQFKK